MCGRLRAVILVVFFMGSLGILYLFATRQPPVSANGNEDPETQPGSDQGQTSRIVAGSGMIFDDTDGTIVCTIDPIAPKRLVRRKHRVVLEIVPSEPSQVTAMGHETGTITLRTDPEVGFVTITSGDSGESFCFVVEEEQHEMLCSPEADHPVPVIPADQISFRSFAEEELSEACDLEPLTSSWMPMIAHIYHLERANFLYETEGDEDCAHGGPGASKCSFGTYCTVTCRDGYYACCYREGANGGRRCRCRPSS